MNRRLERALAVLLLLAAGPAPAGDADARGYTPEQFRATVEALERSADIGFFHMGPAYGSLSGRASRGDGDVQADALLHLARVNAGATNETQAARFLFAVTWLDEFGGTNALPFLLEEMKREEYRGRSLAQLPGARHMTVASFFRIANRKNATNALHEAAAMLADERWEWMRYELYYESTQSVCLHESTDRLKVAKAGGGVVNLRPVREPICGFLAECYGTETDPGRFAFLDGFLRSKLPEWKTDERRLRGAQRMLRLRPDSKEAAGVVRSVQDARAAQAPDGSAPAGPGDASDTETVDPYVPPPPGMEFKF